MLENILNDQNTLIFCAFVLLVLSDFGFAALYAMNIQNFLKDAHPATATVTDFAPGKKGAVRLVVSYRHRLGNQVTAQSKIYAAKDKYKVGDTVEVLYSASKEEDVRIGDAKKLWLLPKIIAGSTTSIIVAYAAMVAAGVVGKPFSFLMQ